MSKYWPLILSGFLILAAVLIYSQYDPAENSFFPKCPFYALTGYQCLGCGAQRALHQLLQGNLEKALQYNALFVFALPYILTGLVFEYTSLKQRYLSVQRFLFGYKSMYIVLGIIVVFWGFRIFSPGFFD